MSLVSCVLTNLDISCVQLGALELPSGWRNEHSDPSGKYLHTDGRKQQHPPAGSKPTGLVTLADAIMHNRTLLSLTLAANNLGLGGPVRAAAVASIIQNNNVLLKLNVAANGFKGVEAGKVFGDAIAANTILQELDLSGGWHPDHRCDTKFFQTFFGGLSHSLNLRKSILSLNILKSDLTNENLTLVKQVFEENQTLVSICGATGPQLNVSSTARGHYDTQLGGKDAMVVAVELMYNSGLTSLNLGRHTVDFTQYGGAMHIFEVLRSNVRVGRNQVFLLCLPSCLSDRRAVPYQS
jgi:hypothetical protein